MKIQGWNFRIDELTPSHQKTIVHLVNHLAAHKYSGTYQKHAMKRLGELVQTLDDISKENPWVDDIKGFKKLPIEEDE